MERQIFFPTSNLPFGVKRMIFGGLKGYSEGKTILP